MSIKFSKIKTCLDLDDQITFGAHQGKTISYMLAFEPEYLTWCSKQPNLLFLTERAALALEVSVKQMQADRQTLQLSKQQQYNTRYHGEEFSDWYDDVPF